MNLNTKHKLAKPILFFTALIWGSTFTVAKIASESFSAPFINAVRFTIASICLAAVAYPFRKALNKEYFFHGTLMGLTLFGGYMMQTVGLTMDTSPGKSAFLSTTYCVLVPFLYWFVTKERPKTLHIVCVFICVAGVGILSLQGGGGMTNGDLITVLSGIPGAANIVTSSIACRKNRNPLLLTVVELTVVMILSWACVLFTRTFPTEFPAKTVGGLVYLGVFATALCLFMQTFGLKYAEATIGGMILSLEAVFGVVCSIVLYHEKVTGRMVIGFIIIFTAVILSQLRGSTKIESSDEDETADVAEEICEN